MKRLHDFTVLTAWYLEYLELKNFRPRTLADYRFELLFFCRYLKDYTDVKEVDGITPAVVRGYIAWLYSRKLAGGTIGHKTAVLKGFFKALYRENKVYRDLAPGIHIPSITKRLPENILTEEDIQRIYAYLEDKVNHLDLNRKHDVLFLRDYAVFEILYSTGIRRNELINLTLGNMDYSCGLVEIRDGKGGKDRVVPIGKSGLEIVYDYVSKARMIVNKNNLDILFLSQQGNKLSEQTLRAIVNGVVRRGGLTRTIKIHTLRHTCATHMLNHGADIRYLQELLGHTSLTSTQVYTHVSIKELVETHKKHHPREQGDFT